MSSRKLVSLAGSAYCFLAGILLFAWFEVQRSYYQSFYSPTVPLIETVTDVGTLVLVAMGFAFLRDYFAK